MDLPHRRRGRPRLARLPDSLKSEALDLIQQMLEDPMDVVEPHPLEGYPRHYKVYFAVARYRMTVRIDQKKRHFEIWKIGPREGYYDDLKGKST